MRDRNEKPLSNAAEKTATEKTATEKTATVFTDRQKAVLLQFAQARAVLKDGGAAGLGSEEQVASEIAAFEAAAKAGYDFNDDDAFQDWALKATTMEMLSEATVRFVAFCKGETK